VNARLERERRDVSTGETLAEPNLIRFVADPVGNVTPDLARKLPGRGMWCAATREAVATAVKRQAFSRSAKTKLTAAPDLPDLVETLLARRCLELLGLAKREGVLISGFEKTLAAISAGKAAWVIEASDGSADGRRKLLAAVRRLESPPKLCGAFTSGELGSATGGENVIHVGLLAGRRAGRWTEEVERLGGFRPLLPESWTDGGWREG
jgi:hypothetical protein